MSPLSDFEISREQIKKAGTEGVEREYFEDSLMCDMLFNNCSEHQMVNQVDAW